MILRGQVPHFSWRLLGCQSGGQCHQVSQSVQIPLAFSVTQAVVSQLVLSSGGCRVDLSAQPEDFVPISTVKSCSPINHAKPIAHVRTHNHNMVAELSSDPQHAEPGVWDLDTKLKLKVDDETVKGSDE